MITTINTTGNYLDNMEEPKKIFWSQLFLAYLFLGENTNIDDLNAFFPENTDNILIENIEGPMAEGLYHISVRGQQKQEDETYKDVTETKKLDMRVTTSITALANRVQNELRTMQPEQQSTNLTNTHASCLRKKYVVLDLPKRAVELSFEALDDTSKPGEVSVETYKLKYSGKNAKFKKASQRKPGEVQLNFLKFVAKNSYEEKVFKEHKEKYGLVMTELTQKFQTKNLSQENQQAVNNEQTERFSEEILDKATQENLPEQNFSHQVFSTSKVNEAKQENAQQQMGLSAEDFFTSLVEETKRKNPERVKIEQQEPTLSEQISNGIFKSIKQSLPNFDATQLVDQANEAIAWFAKKATTVTVNGLWSAANSFWKTPEAKNDPKPLTQQSTESYKHPTPEDFYDEMVEQEADKTAVLVMR